MGALVTYTAPAGDDEIVRVFGYRFISGQPVEIEDAGDNSPALSKLRNHPLFHVEEPKTGAGDFTGDVVVEPARRKAGWPVGRSRKAM